MMKFITRLNKHFSWIDAALTSVLIILITIAGYLLVVSKGHSEATEEKKNATTESAAVQEDTMDSNYPGIKIIIQTSNSKKAPYTIQYPQSIHNEFNEKVEAYVKKAKESYLAELSDQPLSKNAPKRELNISFETIQHASNTYSFVMVHQSYIGHKTGKFDIRSFHLNPETGEQLVIEDLFTVDDPSLKEVTEQIRNVILQDPSYQQSFQADSFAEYIATGWDSLNNFALTDEAVIFYFPKGLFTKAIDGPPIISVPLHELSHQLTAHFQPAVDAAPVEQLGQPNENPDNQSPQVKNEPASTDSTNTTEPVEVIKKRVALTFDDGPNPKTTEQILDILNKYDAKATFFMLGSRVEYYPDIAKKVQANGHELGNHTWSHKDLTKLSAAQIANEINRTTSIIEQVTGEKSTVFRPPYGAVNAHVRGQTAMPVILWDVDTMDWKYHDPVRILQTIQQHTKDGSIILMHDIHQSTADGLDNILAYLQGEGYMFVTVSDLHPNN